MRERKILAINRTDLGNPVRQCLELGLTKHGIESLVLCVPRAMSACIKDKERHITVLEVVIMFTVLDGIVVGLSIVPCESCRSHREGDFGIVTVSDVIVLNLQAFS
jgi:hypothetical protein